MRIVVFGAGAIGSVLAARLAVASHDVAVITRGRHLSKIMSDGLVLQEAQGRRTTIPLQAAETGLPPGDVVIVTLKSYSLPEAAPAIAALCKPGGLTVFLQNGMPWWYFRDASGPMRNRPLPSLDPGGVLDTIFPRGTMAGGVVMLAASLLEPGVVVHTAGHAISIGLPDAHIDDRLRSLAAALTGAGFEVLLPGDPRPAIWAKLLMNVAINGISALTGATNGEIRSDDELPRLLEQLGLEVTAVAAAVGYTLPVKVARPRDPAAQDHRSSTQQDLTAGRAIEHEALFGSLLSLARELGVFTPYLATVSALLRCRAQQAGCLPPA